MRRRKTHTLALSEDLGERSEVKRHLQQRQQLLEKMGNSEVVRKRFWEKADIKGQTDCWEWKADLFKRGGYARFSVKEKGKQVKLRANRVAYYFSKGEFPGELFVCHTCDNPKCVNPNHLFLGTHAINQKDKVAKGRTPMGTKHVFHILTEDLVFEMRKRCLVLGESRASVAKEFNIKYYTVVCAVLGRNWKHVPFPEGFQPHEL